MGQLFYEGQAVSNLACEMGFQRREVTSKEALQAYYNQISRHPRAVGHVLSLNGQQVMLMIEDEPKDYPPVVQHLLEDLQRELTNQLKYEPTISATKRKQRIINTYSNMIDAIEALPEDNGEVPIKDIELESVND
ncbi:hypothetical protein ACF3NG_02070 [Aerococcaceae bacterium WGS1372]